MLSRAIIKQCFLCQCRGCAYICSSESSLANFAINVTSVYFWISSLDQRSLTFFVAWNPFYVFDLKFTPWPHPSILQHSHIFSALCVFSGFGHYLKINIKYIALFTICDSLVRLSWFKLKILEGLKLMFRFKTSIWNIE